MTIRVKYVLSHPIQYFAPLMQRLANSQGIELQVIYAIDAGARDYFDPGFSRQLRWDRPLLQGYQHAVLNPGKGFGRGFNMVRADGVGRFLKKEDTDVIITHGWGTHLALGTMLCGLARRIPVLNRAEAQKYAPSRRVLSRLRPLYLYPLLRRLSGFLAIGSLNREFYLEAGVRPERIFWAPYSIDTSGFMEQSVSEDEKLLHERKLGLGPGSFRVIFCGKLIEHKRPLDVINAVARMPSCRRVEVLFVGEGALRPMLEKAAAEKGVKAHFLGFRNQGELPLLYSLAHVLVLPSSYEPWGLVVNEAMTMGRPAVVSDVAGCGPDLVMEDESGFICPVGDTAAMARALESMASSRELYQRLSNGARQKVSGFSLDRTLAGYLEAIRTTCETSKRSAPRQQ